MKQILTFLLFVTGWNSLSYGQGQIIMTQAGTGQLFRQVRGDGAQGSPFFLDKPMAAEVTLSYGKTAREESVIFDASNNRLLLYRNDSLFHFTDAVIAFTLETPTQQYTFKRIPSSTPGFDNRFVEVLAEGKITYVIDHRKKLETVPVYGGANEQEYKNITNAYVITGKNWKAVDPSASLLRSLTNDKATEMQSFFESARFNFKKDAGFAAGIQYYNSLFK